MNIRKRCHVAWKEIDRIHIHNKSSKLSDIEDFKVHVLSKNIQMKSSILSLIFFKHWRDLWGVCLPWFFSSHISLIWRRHHYRWGLHILTFARHSWLLSSEDSLACHTYCDMGHPFIMVISEDPWHSHLIPNVSHMKLSLPVFRN